MEEEIKKWSTGKAKLLEEHIDVTKERDDYKIETCDLGELVRNKKQAITHSLKGHKNCASDVKSEADTTQEGEIRFLDQVKIMQKEKSDITGEISNMVSNHAHAEE